MPSTVNSLLKSAGLTWVDAVPWGTRVPLDEPGVYIVALSKSPDNTETRGSPPISHPAVAALLDARPELLLDGFRPTAQQLAGRLGSMWFTDETVLYVGLAGASVTKRMGQYYRTALGARQPHAGGWPLKTVAGLDRLWVHHATCTAVDVAEQVMLDAFMANVSVASRATACDPGLPLPFANLMDPRGPRKRHGITGAREPRTLTAKSPGIDAPPNAVAPGSESPLSQGYSQPIRAGDLKAGRIRIPNATKPLLPDTKETIEVVVRGQALQARWDPRPYPIRCAEYRESAIEHPRDRERRAHCVGEE
ncbi:hypothetical protein ABQF34_17320 [Mycolicibacterium boenickei]